MKWSDIQPGTRLAVRGLQWSAGLLVILALGWYERRWGRPADFREDVPVNFECRARRFNSWNP